MIVYAAVTADKYELIIEQADSIKELAQRMHVNKSGIYYKLQNRISNSVVASQIANGTKKTAFFVRKITLDD